jgi:hypothetical protein
LLEKSNEFALVMVSELALQNFYNFDIFGCKAECFKRKIIFLCF